MQEFWYRCPQMRIPTDAENPAGYESRELPRILQEM